MKSFPFPSGSRRHGFTLTELLVVVVVMAVLAAATLPVFLSIRKSAGSAVTVTNLRQVQAANASFASDNGGFFVGNAPFGQQSDFWGGQTWFSYMPFVNMLGVDTAGEGENGDTLTRSWQENFPEALKCGIKVPEPSPPGDRMDRNFTIAMNWTSWSHKADGSSYGANGGGFWEPGKILQTRVRNPSKLIMFYDSNNHWGTFYNRLEWERDDGNWNHGMAFRNKGGRCNVVFADGHVGSLTRDQVERDNDANKYFFWYAD